MSRSADLHANRSESPLPALRVGCHFRPKPDIDLSSRRRSAASPKRTLVVTAAFVVYGGLQRGTNLPLVSVG